MRTLLRILILLSLGLPALPAAAGPVPASVEAAITAAKDSVVADAPDKLDQIAAAEALAQQISDPRQRIIGLATTRWLGAEAHLRSASPDLAVPLLAQGLRLVESINEPLKVRGDLLISQGALYMQREQAEKALDNFQQAYRIYGEVREPRSQAIALQNIASLYQSANDGARAENYYKQAAQAYGGDATLSLSLHNNRGNVLLSLERYAEAAVEFELALRLAQRLAKPTLEVRVLVNLARAQVDLKRFDEAERTLARGFALVRGSDAEMPRRHLLATSARLAADRGNYPRAAELIRESFAGIDPATTANEFRNAHLYAHEIFRKTGHIRLSLVHLEALKRLSDEAAKVATSTSAALMAAKFNYTNQQLTIQQLTTEQLRKTAEFQRTLFLSIGGGTLVLIALLTFGLVTIRRSRNQVRAANVVLGETNVALEKALRAKTEFLATTSHEIRTPLNGILGMTQVMLTDSKLTPEIRDRIDIVHGAGVTMRALVDDILDVAKMETGNLTVEAAPMDLCATLKEVTRIWEEQARAKGLVFRLELSHAPRWIVSDAGRLRQIVFNLLSNAIKFTERGTVTLRAIDEGQGDARRLKLVISDTGIGIPPEKFDDIFESFRQVDTSTTRKFGGTGLGLTICRNLARALGGDVTVASEPDRGSAFTIDLPLVPSEAPAAVAPGEANAGGTMLILDRNPIARSMLRTLFEPRVAELRFAGTADEALAALAMGDITYLLADEATLKVADADAVETLRALVAISGAAETTVLWMQPDAEIRSQLSSSGIGRIVEKPISGAALVDAVIPASPEKSGKGSAEPLVSEAA
ncbi:ATP-binding response regulator [Sphingomonas sp. M1-B02]|uniref:ATP-binding response regulator n=1 Tax=Sphingomonas sp. M1-B02 TaxID=3114300 RepID=UPI00223FA9B2|nr:ATP-binding protein [Sphingomonas sp. S6-11]UZK66234.1 ATP-binding protein [Sphingomonas sp. S6-11]